MGTGAWPPRPSDPSPVERDLLRAAEQMNFEAARSMVRVLPGCEFEEFEDLYVRSHPLPTETLNEARVTNRPSDPFRVVEAALVYFQSRSPRWRLVCREELRPVLADACREAGLSPGGETPTMILPSDPGQATPEGFDCRRVEDMAALEVFQRTFSLANKVPDTGFWRSKALLAAPDWDLFLGFLDGRPVATGLGFTSHQVTGVWAIATLPEHRGRGIGTAITWAVVNGGADKGALATHLWATEMGFPVYQRMGFRHVENKAIWNYQRPG
jgi:GNAT superfamily N-acetyltransferase